MNALDCLYIPPALPRTQDTEERTDDRDRAKPVGVFFMQRGDDNICRWRGMVQDVRETAAGRGTGRYLPRGAD